MDRKKETIKEQNYFWLPKIAIAIFGSICTGLGIWGLFGLTKVHLAQSKVEGTVVSITLKTIPNSNKHSFIYTFEYIADDGEIRQLPGFYYQYSAEKRDDIIFVEEYSFILKQFDRQLTKEMLIEAANQSDDYFGSFVSIDKYIFHDSGDVKISYKYIDDQTIKLSA